MASIPFLMIAPTLMFAVGLIAVGFRVSWRRAGACLAIYLSAAAAEWWAIRQSRSSTAAIGFLFLPAFAALVGMLGIGFVASRRSRRRSARAGGFVLGVLAALGIGVALLEGIQTIHKNHVRDAAAAERRARN